jgi:hypothetical protein
MFARAAAIWFVILAAAILNGLVRDIVLVPRLGDLIARAVSCFTLAGAILLVTWISLRWIHPTSAADAWTIGAMWLAMTLAFEFIGGHYLFRTPWSTLVADYNILEGRLWIVVLIATITAPALVYRAGHNPVPRRFPHRSRTTRRGGEETRRIPQLSSGVRLALDRE